MSLHVTWGPYNILIQGSISDLSDPTDPTDSAAKSVSNNTFIFVHYHL